MAKWSREKIIREILRREAAGLPLALSKCRDGVDAKLYQAGSRIFGSWGNAVQAAGIAPERARIHEYWPAAKILSKIRALARRRQPIQPGEMKRRHGYLMQAARRCFGSWSKAVVAAGVDPNKLKGIVPWTRSRIIEAILTRALNCEPLGSQSVKPRSLSKAGAREFGSWPAALRAAGVDPQQVCPRAQDATGGAPQVADADGTLKAIGEPPRWDDPSGSATVGGLRRVNRAVRAYRRWTPAEVLEAIRTRAAEGKPMNPGAVSDDDDPLYRVAARRFGNWRTALLAAGIDMADARP